MITVPFSRPVLLPEIPPLNSVDILPLEKQFKISISPELDKFLPAIPPLAVIFPLEDKLISLLLVEFLP